MTNDKNKRACSRRLGLVGVGRFQALWMPIILLESYLAFTVLIFFYGPVEWAVPNASKLITFLAINYGGLWIGYSWGIKKAKTILNHKPPVEAGVIRVPSKVMWLLLFSMVFNIVSTMTRLYAIKGDVGTFMSSFLHPGEAYREAQVLAQMDRDGEVMAIARFSWVFRISTLFGTLNALYFPLALACWSRMSLFCRAIFFLSLISTVMFTVGMGAQSGIGFLVFASLPVVLYKVYVAARSPAIRHLGSHVVTRKKLLGATMAKFLAIACLGLLVSTVIYFQLDRAEDSGRMLNAAKDLGGQFSSPADHGIVPITGGRLNYGIVMACNYFSHAYMGLALAMELPFEWTYGLGWSKALHVIYHDYLGGDDLFGRSYIIRNSEINGWPLAWWSTIFPWIASDTTFYGTVLFTLGAGFIIGRVWGCVIITGNPIGFAVLGQMFTLVFMFPANNALAQTLESLFSFIGIVGVYLLSKPYAKTASL